MVMGKVGRKVLCKFASPVLNKGTPRFLAQVEHWLEHKGEEWLAERWKVIRNAAYKVREGRPEDARTMMEEKGISVREDRPVARGEWGRMQLSFIEAQSPTRLRTCDALLRGYTALTLKAASKKQKLKVQAAITSKPAVPAVIPKDVRENFRAYHSQSGDVDWKAVGPSFRGLSGTSSYYTGDILVPRHIKDQPFGSLVSSALVCGYVPESVVQLLGDNPLRRKAAQFQQSQNRPSTCGKVVILQEGGCKPRAICLPSAWVQAYYKPLQDELCKQVRLLEAAGSKQSRGISCMYNQPKGAYALQEWMVENKDVYSYDLSSATDRFPLQLQLAFLALNGHRDWVKPVEDVARSNFKFDPTGEEFTYSVGQPMGVNFSFPLFHLTHMSLLDSIARITCPSETKPVFAVLGDDVLICNKDLASRYRDVLAGLGVEISRDKSLEGVDIQTFAGFTGISSSRGLQVFRPFKHGVDFAIQGRELNLVSALGSEVRKWSNWWSRSHDLLVKTYPLREPDLTPIQLELPDNLMRCLEPSSRWLSAQTLRVLSSELKMEVPDTTPGSLKQSVRWLVEDDDSQLVSDERKPVKESKNSPSPRKGDVTKLSGRGHTVKIEVGFLGEGADWNRLWATLLKERGPLQYRDTFSPEFYREQQAAAGRINQMSRDPLIRELKRWQKKAGIVTSAAELPKAVASRAFTR